jgi:hypothetical protein
MRKIIAVFIVTIGCAVVMKPLYAAGIGDTDLLYDSSRDLFARYFVDPNFDASKLQQIDLDQKEMQKNKTSGQSGSSGKERTVFNINLTVGASLVFDRVERAVSPDGTESGGTITFYYFWRNIETKKSLGASPVINLGFIFNVARYFALGFGADAGYLVMNAHTMSVSYSSTLQDTSRDQLMAMMNYNPSTPRRFLEVPVYGLMRVYFSPTFSAAYLSVGGGMDFLLLGHPSARSTLIRGGFGFTLDNGFTMDFSYQYNFDAAEKSSLTNIKEMHRGTVTLGYCFNVGEGSKK